ncbi:dTDP-4-dehydrorhamnose reductase [Enterococcus phoeniculicola]|jgi:dTDP-4-dehydrorhamnose reductase|uniref:dTDP-4-dehydrorhamnose reductase n=1 Tax=Enterococcus phoeniculicola ATCC BAA-412 TaxID=1158610 RepID=R3TRA0_9ENTE|nr:dTDP-4-dehydrorhamnose reductase [Enterococcus phoeniculicola]EOL44079.1 dTDP-4-dehydrorhamnose reductase [Enterococcus phoeniculicola ATCC BAA-412]EOT75181.1 dTDP-4-dehydrorhamnose reductase [Enterococcus phoeniculicola ATCC BAA-412]OJG71631.1 dTDP-4-dehydrorhamnose reductase [Enterococcus phoeniculicola]
MTKILITGSNGQLGTELSKLLENKRNLNDEIIKTDSKDLDITNRDLVLKLINEMHPEVIYHCAAYTAVDLAEDEGKTTNWSVNVDGTKNVALAAEKVGATLIYISTDYVFEGSNSKPRKVDDLVNPKNEYGRAKLAGEKAVQEICSKYYIIRTSWVFGKYGKNFVFTMQNLAKKHDTLTVVNDQIGRPTWTKSLAEFMLFIVKQRADYGIYHFSNEGICSWHEFASEILRDSEVIVKPISSSEFSQKAKRPSYSILDLDKTKKLGFDIIPWKEALAEMMQELD